MTFAKQANQNTSHLAPEISYQMLGEISIKAPFLKRFITNMRKNTK